ncbi:MAG: hypothetical protein J0H29_04225 [Sphingobacteriales bacterium]|nr:hypothetical protein [Sphingobacteriales bacterium]
MIKRAQKLKMGVACLLLFSFLNLMTFLPGGNFHFPRQPVSVNHTLEAPECCDEARSTVLELILENIAGLRDYLPDSEKPDFSYHFFNLKLNSGNNWIVKDLHLPSSSVKPHIVPDNSPRYTEDTRSLPLLQYHNFIFRLTPF